jgi:hypothetical protein
MDRVVRSPESERIESVELGRYLWEEYKYRHDLIWKLLFRVTTVVTLLSIAPFTIDDLTGSRVGTWINVLPVLALAMVLLSWPFLVFEFRLFEPIDKVYVVTQNRAIGETVRPPMRDFFKLIILVYPGFLFLLTLVVAIRAWSM